MGQGILTKMVTWVLIHLMLSWFLRILWWSMSNGAFWRLAGLLVLLKCCLGPSAYLIKKFIQLPFSMWFQTTTPKRNGNAKHISKQWFVAEASLPKTPSTASTFIRGVMVRSILIYILSLIFLDFLFPSWLQTIGGETHSQTAHCAATRFEMIKRIRMITQQNNSNCCCFIKRTIKNWKVAAPRMQPEFQWFLQVFTCQEQSSWVNVVVHSHPQQSKPIYCHAIPDHVGE